MSYVGNRLPDNPFQSDTLPKVMAGCHIRSKVIWQKILQISCSRSILPCGKLREHSKWAYTTFKLIQRRAEENQRANSKSYAVSQTEYAGAGGIFYAIWEVAYGMKGGLQLKKRCIHLDTSLLTTWQKFASVTLYMYIYN